jgi:hypothetical protein
LGVGLLSNDKMGVLASNASFIYNTTEQAPGFNAGFTYSRFFPVLYLNVTDQNRKLQYVDHTDRFTERTAAAGFAIPLNFSRGIYSTRLDFGAGLEEIQLQGGSVLPLNYYMGFVHIRQAAPRDLAPAWSQILRLSYSSQVVASP